MVDTPSEAVESRLDLLYQKRAQATAAVIKEVFKVGDQVWLDGKNLTLPYQSNKLAPRRQGPFHIKRIISPVAFQLDLPPSWRIHDVFHMSLLSSFKETPVHGPNYSRPPPDLVDEDPEYEVEAIVNHRFFGQMRRLQYLIKWKGYPHSDNTWEPVQNLHADALVRAYHHKHPLEDKSCRKVRVHTLSNWTPQSTPSISIRTHSSHLLATITPPTGKKPPYVPPCPPIRSTCPTSPLHPPPPICYLPCQEGPLLLKSPPCPLAPSWPPSMPIPTSPPRNSVSSFTVLRSPSRPGPPSMPLRWPASRTPLLTSKKIWAKSLSATTHPLTVTYVMTASSLTLMSSRTATTSASALSVTTQAILLGSRVSLEQRSLARVPTASQSMLSPSAGLSPLLYHPGITTCSSDVPPTS